MKNLHILLLVVSLLCWTACDQPDELDGNEPIEVVNGNETEIITEPSVDDIENNTDAENDDNGEDDDNEVGNDDEPVAISVEDFTGDGTPENPYLITTTDGLQLLAERVNCDTTYANSHYRLTANINLQGVEWMPIGTSSNRFFGSFDGNGKIISGLHITQERTDNGLFGVIGSGGKVCNLGVSGIVTGGDTSGGIAGASFGTVENCYSAVTVSGKNHAGGIVGQNRTNSRIARCYSTGSVTGTGVSVGAGNSGGITGYNSGTVTYCVSLVSTVDGVSSAGRIIGNSPGNSTNNKAPENILVNGIPIVADDGSKTHGAAVSFGTPLSTVFNNWDTDIWQIPNGVLTKNGELPTLK